MYSILNDRTNKEEIICIYFLNQVFQWINFFKNDFDNDIILRYNVLLYYFLILFIIKLKLKFVLKTISELKIKMHSAYRIYYT